MKPWKAIEEITKVNPNELKSARCNAVLELATDYDFCKADFTSFICPINKCADADFNFFSDFVRIDNNEVLKNGKY